MIPIFWSRSPPTPHRAHHRNLTAVARQVQAAQLRVDDYEQELPTLLAAAQRAVPTRGEHFHAVITGTPTTDRARAADLLRHWAVTHLGNGAIRERPHGVIAHLGGHDITATEIPVPHRGRPDILFALDQVPRSDWHVTVDALLGSTHNWKTRGRPSPS